MAIVQALLKTGAAFMAVLLLGQYVISPVLKGVTRFSEDTEIFTVMTVFIVMLTALATAQLGLSLTLGAFLAGMVLAETPYRALLQSELRPFRTVLLAFFFVAVGSALDPALLASQIGPVRCLR